MQLHQMVYVTLSGKVEPLYESQRQRMSRRAFALNEERIHPAALEAAVRIADGDLRRLRVLEDRSVLVQNRPR